MTPHHWPFYLGRHAFAELWWGLNLAFGGHIVLNRHYVSAWLALGPVSVRVQFV